MATAVDGLSYAERQSKTAHSAPSIELATGLSLFVAVVVSRIPGLTTVLYNWDSANFALGIRYYDVTQHHPHPPGYFLYVAFGNLFSLVAGDANRALVAVSLLLSALAVPATYALGVTIYDRRIGIGAAALLATSVTFWGYGGIALAYPALALFAAWTGLQSYRAGWLKSSRAWVPLAVVYGFGAGFRPDLLVFLLPLWLAGALSLSKKVSLNCLLLSAACVLAWLVPTIALSGGAGKYLAVLSAYTNSDVLDRYSSTRNGLGALLVNVRDVLSYTWYSLYAISAALLIGAALLLRSAVVGARTYRHVSDLSERPVPVEIGRERPLFKIGPLPAFAGNAARAMFFALWLAPLLAFYTIVHIGDPGYAFSFLPALCILGAKSLDVASGFFNKHRLVTFSGMVAALALLNAGIFYFYPRLLTYQGIRSTDRLMSSKLNYLRANRDDGSVLLLSYPSYRTLQFYLPEWRESLWVDPFAPAPITTALPPNVKTLLVVDPVLLDSTGPRPPAETVAMDGGSMSTLPVRQGQTLTFGAGILRLE